MTVTLLASADEPRRRRDPQDPPPVTGSPWHPRISQHRRATNPIPAPRKPEMTGPNVFAISICSVCGALPGDIHTCATDVAGALVDGPLFWPLGGVA